VCAEGPEKDRLFRRHPSSLQPKSFPAIIHSHSMGAKPSALLLGMPHARMHDWVPVEGQRHTNAALTGLYIEADPLPRNELARALPRMLAGPLLC